MPETGNGSGPSTTIQAALSIFQTGVTCERLAFKFPLGSWPQRLVKTRKNRGSWQLLPAGDTTQTDVSTATIAVAGPSQSALPGLAVVPVVAKLDIHL